MKLDQIKASHLDITDAKTYAGWRQVPVHSKLVPTVRSLVKESKDGYLLSCLMVTKYGDRGGAISKRFGRRKSAAGFGPSARVPLDQEDGRHSPEARGDREAAMY
jgi:hypothetical protein